MRKSSPNTHDIYDYYMAKTEVTNAQYATFLQATGHEPPGLWENGQPPDGKQDYPVVEAVPPLSVIERNKPRIAQISCPLISEIRVIRVLKYIKCANNTFQSEYSRSITCVFSKSWGEATRIDGIGANTLLSELPRPYTTPDD